MANIKHFFLTRKGTDLRETGPRVLPMSVMAAMFAANNAGYFMRLKLEMLNCNIN